MKQEIQLLKSAAVEIKQLRQSNMLMSARLDMFDKMMLIFNTRPAYQNEGLSEDIVWQMEKFIESNKE